MQTGCHPEQAFFAQRKPALSLPKGIWASRAFGSLPHSLRRSLLCSVGATGGLVNFASSTGMFCLTSVN